MVDLDFDAQASLLERLASRRINPLERRQLMASAEALRSLGEIRAAIMSGKEEDGDVEHMAIMLGSLVGLRVRS